MTSRAAPDGGPAVLLSRRASVLTATLNRPRTLNAYDVEMRDGLYAALELASSDPTLAAFVVRGNGRAFCAGGDLSEFGLAPSPIRAREIRAVRDVWGLWSRLPCVSIAAVHGHAAGGGFEMALLCDFVVCASNARFSLPETGLGLVPGVGGTQTLPRAVGLGRAARVLLAGESLDARAAQRAGIAIEVIPVRRLRAVARRLAERLAAVDVDLLRAAKAAVVRGADLPLSLALGVERRLAAAVGRHLP
jgi:enoyl-CoA hydratase